MASKIDYVTLVEGGKAVNFKIRDLRRFEVLAQLKYGGAYAMFRTIGRGDWTIDLLEHVLTVGYQGANGGTDLVTPPYVSELLQKFPGYYAPVAARVLEAALFGLEPEEATIELVNG